MNDPSDPMARIVYDFDTRVGHCGPGSYLVDTRSDAEAMCAKLNEIWGEGSHRVEVLNMTKAEAND